MRTLIFFLPVALMTGCATKEPVALQPPPVSTVAAYSPVKAVETRYEVRGYREAANPEIRHDAHAVYRRTVVPPNAADDAETVPRVAFAPASIAPLSGDDELAAELATQRAITAELHALRGSMAETERRMQDQYAQLVRQSSEAAKVRDELEAERRRQRAAVQSPAPEAVTPKQAPSTEAKW